MGEKNGKVLENEVMDYLSKKLLIEREKISLESHLQKDLAIDSLDSVQMIMDLEDKYRIHIEDEAAEKFSTIGDVVKYISANLPEYQTVK